MSRQSSRSPPIRRVEKIYLQQQKKKENQMSDINQLISPSEAALWQLTVKADFGQKG